MRKRIAGILLLVLLMVPGAGLSAQQSDRQLFRSAEQRLEAGNAALAARAYQDLIRDFPDSPYVPDARARLGMALYGTGDYRQAIAVFESVQRRYRSSRYYEAVPFWLGITWYQLQDFSTAADYLAAYLAGKEPLRPFSDDQNTQLLTARHVLANSLQALGRTAEADSIISTVFQPAGLPDAALENTQPQVVLDVLRWKLELQDHEAILALHAGLTRRAYSADDLRFADFAAAEAGFAVGGATADVVAAYRSLTGKPDAIAGLSYQRLFQTTASSREEQEAVIRLAERDLAGQPDILVPFWVRVGQSAFNQDDFASAEQYFLKAWEARSVLAIPAETALYISRLSSRRGEVDAALAVLTEFEERFPAADPRIRVAAANLLLQTGRYQDVVDRLAPLNVAGSLQSTNIVPEIFAQAIYLNVSALYSLRQIDAAQALINSALGQGREGIYTAELLDLRGRIELEKGQYTEAAQSFRQLLVSRPDDRVAASGLLRALLATRSFQAAYEEGTKHLGPAARRRQMAQGPVPDRAYTELQFQTGLAATALGNYAEAEELFVQITRDSNLDWYRKLRPGIFYYTGWAQYRQLKDRAAVQSFAKMLDADSSHPLSQNAAFLSGWASYRLGEFTAAAGYFNGARVWVPDSGLSSSAWFLVGRSYRAARNNGQALETLRAIWEARATNEFGDDAQYERGEILMDTQRYREAAVVYQELYEQAPGSQFAVSAVYRRAEALAAAGSHAEARQAFQMYRDRYPQGPQGDGALYNMGLSSVALGENGAATLYWQRLGNEYTDSSFRFDALLRTARILEEQGERSRALTLYSELNARYATEAAAAGLPRKVQELALVLTGLSDREAALWVTIEKSGGAATAEGRNAVLELGDILILEQTGVSTNRGNLIPLLRETAGQTANAGDASRAAYLLGEWQFINGNAAEAAVYFVLAGDTAPASDQRAPTYYYRGLEALLSLSRTADANNVLQTMRRKFPNHQLTTRAQTLVNQGRN